MQASFIVFPQAPFLMPKHREKPSNAANQSDAITVHEATPSDGLSRREAHISNHLQIIQIIQPCNDDPI